MLDDVVQREIDLPQISLFLGGHQPGTKVINRREALVIVSLRITRNKEGTIIEGPWQVKLPPTWRPEAFLAKPYFDSQCRPDW